MNGAQNPPFVPILTVLPEFGGPFIWVVRRPDQGGVGPCLCDSMGWDESMPLSEGLFMKFSDWTNLLDQTLHIFDGFGENWDWLAFHARGLHLSRWLKEDVGDAYRVVYCKSGQDPNHCLDERTEILADGTLLALVPFCRPYRELIRFCERIVSGGQAGAERGAPNFAIDNEYIHGGWISRGRVVEDGVLPAKYQLTEILEDADGLDTYRNVVDSDATLIISVGEPNDDTLATQACAVKIGKPCLVAQIDAGDSKCVLDGVVGWLRQHNVKALNVAGLREGEQPGIQRLTEEFFQTVDDAFNQVQAASRKD